MHNHHVTCLCVGVCRGSGHVYVEDMVIWLCVTLMPEVPMDKVGIQPFFVWAGCPVVTEAEIAKMLYIC